jgi:metal-responsive CopG/Arc/MetJ family transcriptional regulator
MDKKKIITFELQGSEIDSFERAFKLSGMRSRSELVRFILNQELKDYYKNET